MPLQTIEPRRLYRQIADQLRTLIQAGEYPLGSRLPAERDLAARLGVSRPSVREALIALEAEGLVEVRMGSGIYVLAREGAPSARRIESALGPFDIIRARQVLEGELAAMAAGHGVGTPDASIPAIDSEALVAGLREAIALMEDDIARDVMPLHGDRLFHTRIAAASHNAALLRVVSEWFDERNNPLFERLGHHFEGIASWRCAVDEHRAVVAAIAARDGAAARAAMQRHLQLSHDRFAGTWQSDLTARGEAPRAFTLDT